MDIGNSVERGFTVFFAWLPALLGALVILVVGYFVAKFVGKLVSRALDRAGLDRTLHQGTGGSVIEKITSSSSRLLGTLAFWAILLGTISLAVSVLGIEALTAFVAAIYAYLPNVLAAVLIFLVASAISAGVATLATRAMGGTALGKIVATAAPILVMTVATFMILDQLQIAQNIVVITYAGLIGAIALGSALAFGLGGRDVAREMLQGAYEKGQANKEQFKRDLDQGISRARDEVQTARDELSSSDDASSVDTQRQPVVASRDRDGSTPHDPMAQGLPGETAFEPAHEPAERRNLT
jgi:hypothetical protein